MSSPCICYSPGRHGPIVMHSFEDDSDPYQTEPDENLLGDIVQCWGEDVKCKRCDEKSWRLLLPDEKYVPKET